MSVSVSAKMRSSIGSRWPAWSTRWYTATALPVASSTAFWKFTSERWNSSSVPGDPL